MSQHFIFNEAGSMPGTPGTYAGVRVDVAGDGSLDVQPLPLHPHFQAAEEETPVEEEALPPEQSVAEVAPEQSVISKEEQVETAPEQQTSLPEESPVLQETTQEQV